MKKRFVTAVTFLLILSLSSCFESDFHLFGTPSTARNQPLLSIYYADRGEINTLIGNFDPTQQSDFKLLSELGIEDNGRPHYLLEEAALSLQKMRNDFLHDHPNIPFFVISSTRNWSHQRRIWENKFNGRTLVGGANISRTMPDPLERAKRILHESSMPGTSRHHWGTEVDLNALQNSYFESGNGAILYAWLQKNATRYGWCQPYTAGRAAGYIEEKWHWSYIPIAHRFHKRWMELHQAGELTMRDFDGAAAAAHLAPIYVDTINEECK